METYDVQTVAKIKRVYVIKADSIEKAKEEAVHRFHQEIPLDIESRLTLAWSILVEEE